MEKKPEWLKVRYNQDAVNEVATYLNVHPYELLMHPDDAMALRRLRTDLVRVAHDAESITTEAQPKKVSLG